MAAPHELFDLTVFEVFGTICSTTSSFSMRLISGAWDGIISAIIRRSHSRWIRQRHAARDTAIDQESR